MMKHTYNHDHIPAKLNENNQTKGLIQRKVDLFILNSVVNPL